MANDDATYARVRPILPNLLLATTYALNKSNSKSAIVGLDYDGGLFKPVVKLCSSGSPAKYVTIDQNCWELIADQMDVMTAFFQNSYAFYGTYGNPSRVYMPDLDVIYKLSYGLKSICFEQRPVLVPQSHHAVESSTPSSGSNINDNQQSLPSLSSTSSSPAAAATTVTTAAVEQSSSGNSSTGDSLNARGPDMQPPCKKKKRYDTPPSVTIQEPTFIGLKDLRECIATRLYYLKKTTSGVNTMINFVIRHLHRKIINEEPDKVNNILKDICAFKHYFKANYADLHESARTNFDLTAHSLEDRTIEILLFELVAFGLPWIVKHVNELVQKS